MAMLAFTSCEKEREIEREEEFDYKTPPTNVVVTRLADGTFRLSWNNVRGAVSYIIERSDDITFPPARTGTWVERTPYSTNSIDGTNYYRVRAAVNCHSYWFCDDKYLTDWSKGIRFVGGGSQTGLYMGIIGFNDAVYTRPIDLLTNYGNVNNRNQFQSFVNGLTMRAGTGLYYAVDNAITLLQNAILPDDLVNVSLVTFTDGLDNISIELNPNFNSRDAYRNFVRNRINTTRIRNLPINAYSIGVPGNDVFDLQAFSAGLAAIASNPNNVHEVTNMTEVNNAFRQIANSLTNVNQSQTLRLRIPGGFDDGTRIRFTFDNVSDAAMSNFYIEGTFRRSGTSRTLQNVVYRGLTSNSGTTITGALSGGFVTFTFENTATTAGGNVSTNNVQQWEFVASQSRWQRNSEFGGTGDVETAVDRKSAVIMLVLDCTTSLGNTDFQNMKNAANNFINILVGN